MQEADALTTVVDLSDVEDSLGSDQAPDYTGVEEDATAGAGVVACLFDVAGLWLAFVKRKAHWSSYHIPSMLPNAQLRVAIWTTEDHSVAAI